MELRQLRYLVRVCELGSMGRAAADLGVVTSANEPGSPLWVVGFHRAKWVRTLGVN